MRLFLGLLTAIVLIPAASAQAPDDPPLLPPAQVRAIGPLRHSAGNPKNPNGDEGGSDADRGHDISKSEGCTGPV